MFPEQGQKKFRFPKAKILKAVKANMSAHRKIVKEAQKGYREELKALLENKLVALEEGHEVSMPIHLQIPLDHLEEYESMVQMLEWCTELDIELTQTEFSCYVRDRWVWREQFLLANAPYSDIATTMIGQSVEDGN